MTYLSLLLAAASTAQIRLHVDGDGLFRFARGSQAVYTADPILTTSTGVLASPEGYPLLPQIHVPSDGNGVRVAMDGSVTVSGKAVGRIVLASFGNASLEKIGSYLTSGTRSTIGYPGEGVFGVIRTVTGSNHVLVKQAAPSRTSTIPTIEIALHSEITKPEILLGDIATVTASNDQRDAIAAVSLGATPVFGAERGITRSYLMARLRVDGLDPDKMQIECPVGANVVRKGQKVTEDAIVAAAVAAAKSKLGLDVALRSERSIAEALVPVGDLQLDPREAIATGDGAMVNVEIDVDGKSVGRRTVSLVPTVPTPKVNSGDPVKIRIIRNGASVEVSGKVRASGRVGATITVESDGGAVFTGILRTTSLVEVKL